MNDRIVIYPQDNLIEVIADQLELESKNLSSFAVVFPGKRPAHFLRKEIARRLNQSYIPPQIFSIDVFIQALHNNMRPEKQRTLEPIDAVCLLYEIHSNLKDRIGENHFDAFDSFIPVGIKLFEELEDLHLALLTEKQIEDNLSTLTFNKLFTIPRYYKNFYSILKEREYITRASRYRDVAENINNIQLNEFKQVIFAGFYKYTNAEKLIFDSFSKLPHVKFIYQTDKANENDEKPEMQFIKSPDTHGQVFALSAILKDELEQKGKPDEHSVIVLPTADALFPVLHYTLSLIEPEDYNLALQYPISRTPLYGFLHNLLELVSTRQNEHYSVSLYLKFILHPYTKNIRIGNRTDITRILFHAIETAITGNSSKTLITLEEIESLDEIFSNIAYAVSETEEVTAEKLKEHLKNMHSNLIHQLANIRSLKEFAEKINQILDYIYLHSTAKLHPLFQPYAEALMQTFQQLQDSIAGNISFGDLRGYFNFIQHYLPTQTAPFSGTSLRGLQLLGLLETRGLHFDNVYFLNANDHIIPGRSDNYTLIPQEVREKLGMETFKQRDELSKYYFNLLINGAKRVFIFYEESERSEKSRFVEQLLWEQQKKDAEYSPNRYIKTVRYSVKLTGKEIKPIPKSEKTLSVLNGLIFHATALDAYLNCQIAFYYNYILGLSEKEEISEEIEQKDIGTLVHRILKLFFEPLKENKITPDDLSTERLTSVIEDTFAREFGSQLSTSTFLLKRQVQRQLNNMLVNYQLPIIKKENIIIKDMEKGITINTLGAYFYGRLDRIEERNDRIVVLDYKTGSDPKKPSINFKKLNIENRDSWNEAIVSLQLPLYLMLYSTASGIAVGNIKPAYLYLGNNHINEQSEVYFIEDDMERTERFELVRKLIERLIAEVRDGSKPFLPPPDPHQSCQYCSFKELCGTQWVTK